MNTSLGTTRMHARTYTKQKQTLQTRRRCKALSQDTLRCDVLLIKFCQYLMIYNLAEFKKSYDLLPLVGGEKKKLSRKFNKSTLMWAQNPERKNKHPSKKKKKRLKRQFNALSHYVSFFTPSCYAPFMSRSNKLCIYKHKHRSLPQI